MANRRMLSKTITDSSAFLMMPMSSQALYMHLNQHADDDGYCEFFGIMRMCGANMDDLKVLQAKSFVLVFDDKVLLMKDWHENNYIQKDRYQKSKYLGVYTLDTERIQDVSTMDTQDRLGKDRLESVNNTKAVAVAPALERNEVFAYWEDTIAPITTGVETQRRSSVTLINRYGTAACLKMIRVIAHAHGDRYARKEVKCSSLTSLMGNWDKVVIYAKGVVTQESKRGVVSV